MTDDKNSTDTFLIKHIGVPLLKIPMVEEMYVVDITSSLGCSECDAKFPDTEMGIDALWSHCCQ